MANATATQTLALTTDIATTHGAICIEEMEAGCVYSGAIDGVYDAINSATAVSFFTCAKADGDFNLHHTSGNAACTVTLTDVTNFQIPTAVFGANYMKLVAVGAAWTCHVSLRPTA